ncbi:Rap guanine nucleotide exchange factor 1 [Trichostrongylus colubriformis]|uniref:Rap guanine nucleotide exchange factor 1 n=1 Tax=Trichostrongylus colubriformis TaxID=6319 RepID=A0AAN8FI60_TRICO
MPCSREVEVALRYLQQVISSQSPHLILCSASAVFDAVSTNCNNKDKRLQNALVQLLQCTDRECIKLDAKPKTQEIRDAVEQLSQAVQSCSPAMDASVSGTRAPPTVSDTENDQAHKESQIPSSEARILEEEESLDNLLNKLNLRQVPTFSPTFSDLDTGESDDDYAVTTDERKEEREEKHGQKLCEEEVQKMPDGTEVRVKKTRTVNVQQSRKHVTISSRGAGCPAITRHFTDGKNAMEEDEEEEQSDFFKSDPFDRFRRRRSSELKTLEILTLGAGQSTKTKSVEQTSEVTQSVSERKERDGRVLRENSAQKLDSSALTARQTDTFLGSNLLDRKGEGSYEESSVVRSGPLVVGPHPVLPPRKHVVEYIQTFGHKENTDAEFFRGTALSSYITLNDNLRFHEEQFRKKLQFEFSSAGTSRVTPDFANFAELLRDAEIGPFKLPTKWAEEDEEEAEHIPQRATDWLKRRAITHVPETICTLDASAYLVMRNREDHSKPPEVRGGPRDALIVHATEHTASVLYQEAFLVTYRTFISSHDLINKLITRYVYMTMSSDRASQSAARLTFSVLVRVVDELTGYELSEALVHTVTSFVYRLIHEGNLIFARLLRKRLLDRIVTPQPTPTTVPKPISSKKSYTLFDFRSSDLACQMTYIDAQLFHHIEPPELLWWAQEQDEIKSPNLVAFTEHFNNVSFWVSFWVRTLVIAPSSPKEREKYMMKFIKIMKQLRRLGNFNSYLALLSALVSSPLARLDWNKAVTDALREHTDIMDTGHSYKNYRLLLQQATPPTVPYVGVVLQDLTFVHAGNSDELSAERCGGRRGIVNFLKRWHQYAILDSIRKMKRWNYDITKDEKVLGFFDSFSDFLTEEETWARSHEIKPTNRRKI